MKLGSSSAKISFKACCYLKVKKSLDSLVKDFSEHRETSWRFVDSFTREAEHRSQINWWMSMGGGEARSECNRTIRRSQRDSCFRSAAASNLRTNRGLCMQPTLPCSVCPGKYCERWQKIFHWPADGGVLSVFVLYTWHAAVPRSWCDSEAFLLWTILLLFGIFKIFISNFLWPDGKDMSCIT